MKLLSKLPKEHVFQESDSNTCGPWGFYNSRNTKLVMEQLLKTLFALLAIDSPSGQEEKVADFLIQKLQELGLTTEKDTTGNVIGVLPGKGESLLLTAHMDRVVPGKGNTPIRDGDMLKSDGTTNLGTDDAAGIAVILEAVNEILQQKLSHPPLVILFTVKEEIGLQGARTFDFAKYKVKHGIGYDNAFDAGVIVGSGATYESFDVEIIGKQTHPGKDLSLGINALKIFQEIDWMLGVSDNGATRINVGQVHAGAARNVVPGSVKIQGELRSTLSENMVTQKLQYLEENIRNICEKYGATYTFTTNRHAASYVVDENEPLVQVYKKVLEKRGAKLQLQQTFVASDANCLRGEKGIQIFTISTGVIDEHTTEESVKISDLVQLTKDLVNLLKIV